MRASIFRLVGTISVCCALAPVLAQGPAANKLASFNVSPLRIDIAREQGASQFFVRNDSPDQLPLQVRLFAWSQVGGKDIFEPSQDFIVSPSIIRIDPDRTQTFHVIGQRPFSAAEQASYRVVIDQLPSASASAAGATQTRLRVTVPLYAGGDVAQPAKLNFKIDKQTLIIGNDGGRSARINDLKLLVGDQEIVLAMNAGPRAVLAGSSVNWTLPQIFDCTGEPIRVIARIDQKNADVATLQTCT